MRNYLFKKIQVYTLFLLIFFMIFTPMTNGFNIVKNTKIDEGIWEKIGYGEYPSQEPNGLGEYYLSANCSIGEEASYITKAINLEGLSIATIGFSYYFSGHGVAIVAVYSGGFGAEFWEEHIFFLTSSSPSQIYDFETQIFPNLYSSPQEVYLEFYYFNDYGPTCPGFSIDDLSIAEIGYFDSFEINNGSLSGYVTDPLFNPIEGALIRVYFHGTYEESYSDETGYYIVTNIPICYCMKNCTSSKEGYKTDWVLMGITENSSYDFVLYPLYVYPVFNGSQCNGWWNSPVTVSFVYDPEEVAEIWYFYHGLHQYSEPFIVDDEGEIEILCYWIDFEGVQSSLSSFTLEIDYTQPTVDVQWETYKDDGKWIVKFIITSDDQISGMSERLEIYLNDVLLETLQVYWPSAEFEIQWSKILKKCTFGFLCSDNACNSVYVKVNGSDINLKTNCQKLVNIHSDNLLLYYFLKRFPFVYRFFLKFFSF